MALAALRLSAGLLSVVPVGALPTIDRRTAGRAMSLAPLAVLPVALVAGLVVWAAAVLRMPSLVIGLLAVAAVALGTRAMHLDGLSDTVDALGSGWDRERALAVLRRGDLGPMGAVTLVLCLGLQAAALGGLPRTPGAALAVVLCVCASRTALVLVCLRGVPSMRPEGLGATVAGTVPRPVAVGSVVGAVLLLVLAAWLTGRPWFQGALVALLAAAVVALLVRHVVRRLGGVNGDVMGASIEVALTVLLVGLSA